MQRIVVDQATVNEQVLDEAVRAVLRGGVIAMPTDTLYGLAVDPFRAEAVERVEDDPAPMDGWCETLTDE